MFIYIYSSFLKLMWYLVYSPVCWQHQYESIVELKTCAFDPRRRHFTFLSHLYFCNNERHPSRGNLLMECLGNMENETRNGTSGRPCIYTPQTRWTSMIFDVIESSGNIQLLHGLGLHMIFLVITWYLFCLGFVVTFTLVGAIIDIVVSLIIYPIY